MTTIRTDLGDFAYEAQRVRAQMANGIIHTNVQKALEQAGSGQSPIIGTAVGFASSPYAPAPTDTFLEVDTSGGAVTINLPAASLRNNVPISIKDVSGNASTNNITIVPDGAETIDGLASFVVTVDFGGVYLKPRSGSGYTVVP